MRMKKGGRRDKELEGGGIGKGSMRGYREKDEGRGEGVARLDGGKGGRVVGGRWRKGGGGREEVWRRWGGRTRREREGGREEGIGSR